MFNRRASSFISSPSSQPRVRVAGESAVVWCARGSQTYIVVTMMNIFGGTAASSPVSALLTACLNIIMHEMEQSQDGPISGGSFNQLSTASGLALQAWNANNHQVTYGVLGAAFSALMDYMNSVGWGSCTFLIWDGGNQVGAGQIGLEGLG